MPTERCHFLTRAGQVTSPLDLNFHFCPARNGITTLVCVRVRAGGVVGLPGGMGLCARALSGRGSVCVAVVTFFALQFPDLQSGLIIALAPRLL